MIKIASPHGGDDLPDMKQRIRLIDTSGNQLGVMTLSEATKIADNTGTQLVNIGQTFSSPIYRLLKKVDKPRRTIEE
jgi:hypothetical protein